MNYKTSINYELNEIELINCDNNEIIGNLFYEIKENNLYINKVIVNSSFRGMGLAKILMEEIIKYSNNNNLNLIPICSYSKSYLSKKNI